MSLDPKRLVGKVCVVTGAGKSIGLAVAERYCSYGAVTIMLGRGNNVLEQAERLTAEGYKAHGYKVDVTDHDAVIALFDKIVAEFGPVYALVNVAGLGAVGPFESTEPEEWERVLKTNILGTVYPIKGAIRSMREQREGKIINFSSKAGKSGSKLMAIYGASKGAIITLTQSLAQEYAQHNINVNCLCPDIIKGTGIWENTVRANYSRDYGMSEEEVTKLYESKVPLGHFASLEDICDVVSFLTISADDCTGQSYNVTGGRTMH